MPKPEVKRIKHEFKVSFNIDVPVPPSWAREYVIDALQTWRGQLRPPGGTAPDDPGDLMWYLDSDTVKVSYVKKVKNGSRNK